jgi:hypothetical protein
MGADVVRGVQISRSCAPTMILQPGTQWDLKRQQAAELPHKIMRANKGKSGRISNHTGISKRTHTTLRSCFADAFENPRKTGIMGPRLVSRAGVQALFCVLSAYGCKLLSLYINDLNSRPSLPPSNAWVG